MKRHPVELYEERPNKFMKWRKNLLSGNREVEDSEEEKPKKKK